MNDLLNREGREAPQRRKTPEELADEMLAREDARVAAEKRAAQFEREAVALAQVMKEMPGVEIAAQTGHYFGPGIYMREMRAPAGSIVVGQRHTTEYWNLVMSGKAIVILNGELTPCQAGDKLLSKAGVRKVARVIKELVWLTIHPNPDDCRDIPTIEARLFDATASAAVYESELAETRALLGVALIERKEIES